MRNFLASIKSKYFTPRAIVLMYHKIGSPPSDPWDLAVSPENFEAHLQILQENYNLVSTDELNVRLQKNKIKNKSIAVTFDDGLLNNYELARPLLEKYHIPATFFITDDNIGRQKLFWWDELEEIILHSENLPSEFRINFFGEDINFSLGGESKLTSELKYQHQTFIAYQPTTKRSQLYYDLWEICSPLTAPDQQKIIDLIKEWAGTEIVKGNDVCMTWDQVVDLSRSELFTIGGHTHSHPSLFDHDIDYQRQEINSNKLFLESKLGHKINSFAYPSGRFDDNSLKVIKESGYFGAYTTKLGPVKNHNNLIQINRCQVNNWNKDQFNTELKKWFTR